VEARRGREKMPPARPSHSNARSKSTLPAIAPMTTDLRRRCDRERREHREERLLGREE
jgi:hypothetical protein